MKGGALRLPIRHGSRRHHELDRLWAGLTRRRVDQSPDRVRAGGELGRNRLRDCKERPAPAPLRPRFGQLLSLERIDDEKTLIRWGRPLLRSSERRREGLAGPGREVNDRPSPRVGGRPRKEGLSNAARPVRDQEGGRLGVGSKGLLQALEHRTNVVGPAVVVACGAHLFTR